MLSKVTAVRRNDDDGDEIDDNDNGDDAENKDDNDDDGTVTLVY